MRTTVRLRRYVALVASIGVLLVVAPVVAADGPAVDDGYSVDEDASGGLVVPVETGLLANDIGGSDVLCVVGIDITNLTGSLDQGGLADGSFTYVPLPNFNGSTSFTYTVATKIGDTCPSVSEGQGTVVITVTPVNDPPTAVADFFSALADRTLNIAAPGVLANDSDIDGDPLQAQKVSGAGPVHGTVTLAADGSFSYTPSAGYVGADAFAYRAFDGTDQSQARIVNITVSALPPTPSPTPAVTPTPIPPTPSPEPTPSESPLPSDSGLQSAEPSATGLPTSSPSPGPVIGPVSEQGRLPLLAIAALALLLVLLAVAAVFFVRSQRGDGTGELQPEAEHTDPSYEDEEPGAD